jgi:UDP-glucuronate 4-epimerase
MGKQQYRILVTGAAGFIGAKVCEFLMTQPHLVRNVLNDSNAQNAINVIGLDNLNDYYDVRLKHWRLKQLKNIRPVRSHSSQFDSHKLCAPPRPVPRSSAFHFHKIDLENYDSLRKLFLYYSSMNAAKRAYSNACLQRQRGNTPFTAVINLAARAGVRYSMENPYVYYRTNVLGNLNLLELCREFGVKKYILASTSSLYAGQKMPFKEILAVNEPISPYAASKKGAEVSCYTWHKLYGLDVTILRYFTVYGPAGRPDMSIFRFIYWMYKNQPIELFGDGNQSRDFTYVDDIARGTILGLKPLGFEIINLGGDEPHKMNEVIDIIRKTLYNSLARSKRSQRSKRSKPDVLRLPFHPADILATWADITKAKKILGWKPKIRIDQGIQNSVAWFLQNRGWAAKIKL